MKRTVPEHVRAKMAISHIGLRHKPETIEKLRRINASRSRDEKGRFTS